MTSPVAEAATLSASGRFEDAAAVLDHDLSSADLRDVLLEAERSCSLVRRSLLPRLSQVYEGALDEFRRIETSRRPTASGAATEDVRDRLSPDLLRVLHGLDTDDKRAKAADERYRVVLAATLVRIIEERLDEAVATVSYAPSL